MSLIYLCKNTITGKLYIGCTIRSLDVRKWEHFKELASGKKGGIWQEEYNQYGKAAFEFQVLMDNISNQDILSIEDGHIVKYNCLEPFGYNKKLNGQIVKPVRDYLSTSKLSLVQIGLLLKDILSSTPYLSTAELATKYNYSVEAMQDLLRCKQHRWFAEFFPEEYSQLEKIHLSGMQRKSYLESTKVLHALCLYINKDNKTTDSQISERSGLPLSSIRDLFRGKAYTWTRKEFPVEYNIVRQKYSQKNNKGIFTLVDVKSGTEYVFTSAMEAQTSLGIDRRRVSELLSGKRTHINNTFTLKP